MDFSEPKVNLRSLIFAGKASLGSSPDNPYPTAEAWDGTLLVSNNTNVAKRRQILMDFWIKHSN